MYFFICSRGRVDPRVCGVALDYATIEQIRAGRSPRMRGSLTGKGCVLLADGSIPAYAG